MKKEYENVILAMFRLRTTKICATDMSNNSGSIVNNGICYDNNKTETDFLLLLLKIITNFKKR